MKRWIAGMLIFCMASSSLPLSAESLKDWARETDAIYRQGGIDGGYTQTYSSMLGWGVGLAIGIAILASVMHQSKSS